MADAKALAAKRRQAILSAKTDRLAKLTTKAKNEGDAAGGVRDPTDDPPLAELPSFDASQSAESPLRSRRTPQRTLQRENQTAASPGSTTLGLDEPSAMAWDPAQQEQLLRALMAGRSREGTPSFPGLPDPSSNSFLTPNASNPFLPSGVDPMAGIMQQERPKTLLEKLLPLLHVLSTVAFLVFFLSWTNPSGSIWNFALSGNYWNNWADLASSPPGFGWSEGHRNILWAYLSLQVCLHSIRIFTNSSPPRPPTLLAMVLPHLPPPFPVAIHTAMRYLQMFGLLLDDFSVLVFGIGIVIFTARWYSSTA